MTTASLRASFVMSAEDCRRRLAPPSRHNTDDDRDHQYFDQGKTAGIDSLLLDWPASDYLSLDNTNTLWQLGYHLLHHCTTGSKKR